MIFNESKHNAHWPVLALKELGTFARGKSKHRPRNDKRLFERGTIPLVQTGEIRKAGLYIRKHTEAYNEIGLKQSKLWPAGTLCITIAANIAETAILEYPMCFPDSVVGFNADPRKSSEAYLHYVFTYIRETIQKATSGSIQDNINIDFLTALKFRIPPKSMQDKIVQILSVLDAKIDLNQRMNEELEGMAKLLYDYWFVQFDFPMNATQAKALGRPHLQGHPYRASGGPMTYDKTLKREIPAGWKAKDLCDVTEVSKDSVDPADDPEKLFNLFSIPGFDETGTYSLATGSEIGSNKFVVTKKDLLVSKLNPWTSRVIFADVDVDAVCSTEFVVWRTVSEWQKAFLYVVARSPQFIAYCSQSATGTSNSHKRVNPTVMMSYSIPWSVDVAKTFGERVNPMLLAMQANKVQTQELTTLRDWLLPMLMNGQVTVN